MKTFIKIVQLVLPVDFIALYRNYIVFVIYFILIAILFALHYINLNAIKQHFKGIKRKTWIILLIVLTLGTILRLFIFPLYHHMYIDEPWYLEAAKNINEKQKLLSCYYEFSGNPISINEVCNVIPKPPAWPLLLSILYRIFDLGNSIALFFSSILGSLAIGLIFIFAYLISKNENIALWSAFLLAFTPIYISWSNSAETNNPALFFVLSTAISLILFLETRQKQLLLLMSFLLALTILIRYENIILILLFLLAYINTSISKTSFFYPLKKFYGLLMTLALATMVFSEIFFINIFRPFFIGHAADFYYLNFFSFLGAISFNYLYIVLTLVWVIFAKSIPKSLVAYAIIPLLFFFTLYLPIASESRMALLPGAFLIIISAYSLEELTNTFKYLPNIKKLSILALSIAFIIGFNAAYMETYEKDANKILQTKSVMEIENRIPESCYIISEWPTVTASVSKLKGMPTQNILDNYAAVQNFLKNNGCIYYFHDGYCLDPPISPSHFSKNRCQQMLEIFNHTEEKRFTKVGSNYHLFKINLGSNVLPTKESSDKEQYQSGIITQPDTDLDRNDTTDQMYIPDGIVEISVKHQNYSRLIMDVKNYDEDSILTLSSNFSNSNNYARLLNPKMHFNNGNGGYPFSLEQGIERSIMPSGDYHVNFPIFWYKENPYATLSESFGISESIFLFPRFENQSIEYYIDFSEVDKKVFNSIKGASTNFAFSEKDLFDSYFIFGNTENRCSKNYGDFELTMLSGPDFLWTESICIDVLTIFDYYYKEFGKPAKLKTNYTITYSSARQFGAISSGLFANRFDINFIAHEFFHLWQLSNVTCISNIFYREGMAAYMQYYSQFKSGLKGKGFLDEVFSEHLYKLSNLQNFSSVYFMDESDLSDIRRKNPNYYNALIYGKGALIWKKIADSGINVTGLFISSLKEESCKEIVELINDHENKLYDEIKQQY